MKNAIHLLVAGLFLGFSAFANDPVSRQERSLPAFTEIEAGGIFEVFIKQGEQQKVVVETQEKFMDDVLTEVSKGQLELSTRGKHKIESIKVYITMPELHQIEAGGVCKIVTEGEFSTEDLELDFSGCSKGNMELSSGILKLDCSGASQLTLTASASGTEIESSGASQLNLNLTVPRLSIEGSGASKLSLQGTGDRAMVELSGAANVNADEFTANTMLIEVGGASKIGVNVRDKLSVEGSGAGSVRYKSEPLELNKQLSGGATLRKA